jgi:hypothetical protein
LALATQVYADEQTIAFPIISVSLRFAQTVAQNAFINWSSTIMDWEVQNPVMPVLLTTPTWRS